MRKGKVMKSGVFFFVALMLTMVGLAGCAPAPPPAATPTPAPAVSPTPAPIKPMTLKIHTWGPPRAFTKGWEWWAEEVTKRTDGAIKFELFFNEALGGAKDQLDNIKAGLFEIGPFYPGYAPGKSPLYNIVSLPGLTDDVVAMSKALADISAMPEMQAELKQWNAKFLFAATVPSYSYMGKKPVRKVEDLKGLRIRTVGEQAKLAERLGVVPVSMPAPEIYEALERGTIDGAFFPWTYGFGSYGLYEVSKYAAIIGIGATAGPVVINIDTWNRLDPRVQEIMLDVARLVPEKYAEIYAEIDKKWLAKFKERGIEIYEFPPEEKAKVRELGGKPLWDAWAQDLEKKGLPGRKVLDAFLAAIAKYEKK